MYRQSLDGYGRKWDYVQVESLVEFVLALSWRKGDLSTSAKLVGERPTVIKDHE
jgi:hypothetical protein